MLGDLSEHKKNMIILKAGGGFLYGLFIIGEFSHILHNDVCTSDFH